MWMLSQRAMRRVAHGPGRTARGGRGRGGGARHALLANEVLNTDGETLGGTIAAPQLAHIARHKPFLRKQFRQG
jgi:hypothetical protein